MEPETIIFMPNGDVTLTLIRNIEEELHSSISRTTSSSSLSALGQSHTSIEEDVKAAVSDAAEPPEAEAEPEDDELFYAPDPPTGEDGPLYPPPPRCGRGSDASSRRERSTSPPGSFWAALKRQKERILPLNEEQPTMVPPKAPENPPKKVVSGTQEVHCVASSRHLMLASPHFQTLLNGNSDEAVTLRTTGHVTIRLSGDPDTLVILLNIIHGATRKVPRQVNLELLRKLAVLVKDFKMLESVEFFSDTWIDKLKGDGMPQSYSDDVIQLLFIFLVFDREDEFKNMTRLIQRDCDEKFDEKIPEVPIPHSIIDAIKRDRQFAIETAITVIHGFITKYMDGTPICDSGMDEDLRFACDAMLLGSLMKGCGRIGIWPKPEAPFAGRKWNGLASEIRGIKILDVCSRNSSRRWGAYGPSSNCHGLEDSIEDSMKSIEEGLNGLKLSDYVNKSEDSWGNFLSHIVRPTPPANDEIPEELVSVFLEEDVKEAFPVREQMIASPSEELKEMAFEDINMLPEEGQSAFQGHELKEPLQPNSSLAQYDHDQRPGDGNRPRFASDKKVEILQTKPTNPYYERIRRVAEETPVTYQDEDIKESASEKSTITQYDHARRGSGDSRTAFQGDTLKQMPQVQPTILPGEITRKAAEEPRTTSPIRDWNGIQNGKGLNPQYGHVMTVLEEKTATPLIPIEEPTRSSHPLNDKAENPQYGHVNIATEERRTTPPTSPTKEEPARYSYPMNGKTPSAQYEHVKTPTSPTTQEGLSRYSFAPNGKVIGTAYEHTKAAPQERRASPHAVKDDSSRYSYAPSGNAILEERRTSSPTTKENTSRYPYAPNGNTILKEREASPPATKDDSSRYSYAPNGKAILEERKASPPATKDDSSRYSYASNGKAISEERRPSPPTTKEDPSRYSYPSNGKTTPEERRSTPPATKEDSSRYSYPHAVKAPNSQFEQTKSVLDRRLATTPLVKDELSRHSHPLKPQQEQSPNLEDARVSPKFGVAKQQESRPPPKLETPKQEESKPSSKFGSFFSSKSDNTPQKVDAKVLVKAESSKEERKSSSTIDLNMNTTTEEDDLFTQPQTFRARKSKKRFAVSRF